MRRKSDMWNLSGQSPFLPGEVQQAAETAAADVQVRLTMVEDQLKSQFTSMSAYHQIAIQTMDSARAEARADLDREKATLVSLVERMRDECTGEATRVAVAPAQPSAHTNVAADRLIDVSALARIALLEDRFEQLSHQVGLCLRSQEELANSITFMFEQQIRNSGLVNHHAEANA